MTECLLDATTEIGVKRSNADNEKYHWHISWRNVLVFIYLHVTSVYTLGLILTGNIKLFTTIFGVMLSQASGLGITVGAHRLWSHKGYQATWQLRLILAVLQTTAFQNNIYEWVRDHRVHHKFTDTDADPHNSRRGFFFSHIGWLMVKKHRDVKERGSTVDMSDLEADPIVMWQKRTYFIMMPLLAFVLPTWLPVHLWDEDPWVAWYGTVLRCTLFLNATWCINSVAHIWGTKPYDAKISSVENRYMGVLTLGEGWHNYHHVFPWDYKAAELGDFGYNVSAGVINFFAKIGWAYNLRTVSREMIASRAARTGDGSLRDPQHPHHHMNQSIWGWDDNDFSPRESRQATLLGAAQTS